MNRKTLETVKKEFDLFRRVGNSLEDFGDESYEPYYVIPKKIFDKMMENAE